MNALNTDQLHAVFAKYVIALVICVLSGCGIEPANPSGGIVDNGNRPIERRSADSSSGDAKAQPSATTANDQVPENAPMVAYTSLFNGKFRFVLPSSGQWIADTANDATHEGWHSEAGKFITFTWPGLSCSTPTTTTSTTNNSGTIITVCNTTQASGKTSSGDLIQIDHNLSESDFHIIVMSLGNDPAHH